MVAPRLAPPGTHGQRADPRPGPGGDPATPHDSELWAHVRSLAPQQRAAVVLRYYEDLTEAQTAEVLGVSVGTVKSHTSRALSSLRRSMKEVTP